MLINNKPALRTADIGVHFHCCGANRWEAVEGSASVLVNNKPIHRLGDAAIHCGGRGMLVQASPDVIVGDMSGAADAGDHELHVGLVDNDGHLVAGVPFRVTGPVSLSGTTARDLLIFKGIPAGKYRVTFHTNVHVTRHSPPRRET